MAELLVGLCFKGAACRLVCPGFDIGLIMGMIAIYLVVDMIAIGSVMGMITIVKHMLMSTVSSTCSCLPKWTSQIDF